MEVVASFFKENFPSYLRSLPIPVTFGGFAALSGDQWIRLLPFMLTVFVILWAVGNLFMPTFLRFRKRDTVVNPHINKDNPKVVNLVDMVDIEDIDKEKISYCRCWRSAKFPLCDGTHNKHNEDCGDNVGPLVLKKKAK